MRYAALALALALCAAAPASAQYRLPLDRALVTTATLARQHHHHPAIDVMLPVGTRVYAAHGGVAWHTRDPRCGRGVRVEGDDGYEYVYCHGSRREVTDGQRVETGAALLRSGNTGSSTGPHLHFGVRVHGGRELCPQGRLLAWYAGRPTPPSDATPSTGCWYTPSRRERRAGHARRRR